MILGGNGEHVPTGISGDSLLSEGTVESEPKQLTPMDLQAIRRSEISSRIQNGTANQTEIAWFNSSLAADVAQSHN